MKSQSAVILHNWFLAKRTVYSGLPVKPIAKVSDANQGIIGVYDYNARPEDKKVLNFIDANFNLSPWQWEPHSDLLSADALWAEINNLISNKKSEIKNTDPTKRFDRMREIIQEKVDELMESLL